MSWINLGILIFKKMALNRCYASVKLFWWKYNLFPFNLQAFLYSLIRAHFWSRFDFSTISSSSQNRSSVDHSSSAPARLLPLGFVHILTPLNLYIKWEVVYYWEIFKLTQIIGILIFCIKTVTPLNWSTGASQTIWISLKTEFFQSRKVQVGAPLTQTPASVRCGMEAISLWHCFLMHQPVAQPSARLYCWIHWFSSFS